MVKEEVIVRYTLDEIMKFKDKNNMIPEELKEHCMQCNTSMVELRHEFESPINVIIKSRMNNEDPGDILMKQNIRDLLNKVNDKNFADCFGRLKTMKIVNTKFFKVLSIELIERSMNDPVATQNFDPSDDDVYISNINARIARKFLTKSFQVSEEKSVAFSDTFISILRSQFLEFMDSSKKFNNFNPHRNNMYLGFMNFLGLLHNMNVLPKELTPAIIKQPIKKLVFNEKWDVAESTHAYVGLVKFIKQLLFSVERYPYPTEYLQELVSKLEQFKGKNESVEKFRKGTVRKHDKLVARFQAVIDKNIEEEARKAEEDALAQESDEAEEAEVEAESEEDTN